MKGGAPGIRAPPAPGAAGPVGVEPAPVLRQAHRTRLRDVEAGHPSLLRPGPWAVLLGEQLHVAAEQRSLFIDDMGQHYTIRPPQPAGGRSRRRLPGNTGHDGVLGAEAEHGEDHQRGEERGQEVDEGHGEGVTVAVVAPRVVGGVGDDRAEAQAQGEEHLRGRLSPDLGLQHLLQLW